MQFAGIWVNIDESLVEQVCQVLSRHDGNIGSAPNGRAELMDHAEPGSASVVSCVAFEEMETIDRVPLIHRAMATGFRIRSYLSPPACGFFEEPCTGGAYWKGGGV